MRELLKLKSEVEKEVSELHQILQNNYSKETNIRYLDKLQLLELINIVYRIK